MSNTLETIKKQIQENPIILYMKGSPEMPNCGFSARTVQSLMDCQKPFAYIDILKNSDIRVTLPEYAQWPTFPQLWIKGELVGGCDIVCRLHEDGQLQELVDAAT